MIKIRWFPASWLLIESDGAIVYIDPAYMRTYFDSYPPRVDFTRWPDPIDGLPEADLPPADAILITHGPQHTSGQTTKKQHRPGDGVGYVVRAGGSSLYHAGDTDLIADMAKLGDIGCAFLPVGGVFTMDPAEAVEAASLIKPTVAVPMNYRDPEQAREFAAGVERTGGRCRVMEIGQSIAV